MTVEQKEELKVTDASVEEAAFLAEMVGDAEVPPVVEEEPVAEPVVEVEATPAEEVRKEVIAGFTEEEIRAALEQLPRLQKALDTTNGTLGSRLAEQQKKLEELSAARQATVGKLSADKMTRLSKEFPELAELLAEDLNDVMVQGSQSVDTSQIEQTFNTKLEELRKEAAEKESARAKREQARELNELSKVHKDWKEVAMFTVEPETNSVKWNNPKFGEFVATLPADEQTKLTSVWDAEFVTQKLDAFKASIKPKAVQKKEIVEDATLPRGNRRTVPSTALDEEEAAYRAEMAKR